MKSPSILTPFTGWTVIATRSHQRRPLDEHTTDRPNAETVRRARIQDRVARQPHSADIVACGPRWFQCDPPLTCHTQMIWRPATARRQIASRSSESLVGQGHPRQASSVLYRANAETPGKAIGEAGGQVSALIPVGNERADELQISMG
jgi:hypothetical protein